MNMLKFYVPHYNYRKPFLLSAMLLLFCFYSSSFSEQNEQKELDQFYNEIFSSVKNKDVAEIQRLHSKNPKYNRETKIVIWKDSITNGKPVTPKTDQDEKIQVEVDCTLKQIIDRHGSSQKMINNK